MLAFKKFLYREFIFAVITAAIAFTLFQTVLNDYYLPVFWLLFAIITVFTAVFHLSILQVSAKNAVKFSSKFMMVSGVKMIAYLILIVYYAFSYPENAKIFLISFFILYLLYTVFEVFLILRYFKRKNN